MILEKIPLDLLRSYVAFVESSNMVEAAAKLGVSQPLLTKHLQLLEEISDQPLFAFEGRKKSARATAGIFTKS
jgi:DNA-binding transcriptional LysR family regulator